MGALSIVIFCLGVGLLTARLPHPQGLAQALNWWVIYIALPAVVLSQVTRLDSSAPLLLPALSIWLVFLGGWLLMAVAGRLLGWTRDRIGAMALTAGFGNTSFVGYPLIEALHGSGGLGLAVIADQFGSFIAMATLGLATAALYSGQQVDALAIVRRLLVFPAFWALLAALALRTLDCRPTALLELSERLGLTLTPLALFSIGLQLRLRSLGGDAAALTLGLGWKLLLAPFLVGLLLWATRLDWHATTIIVLQAGMAPMVTAAIIAQQHGLAPTLASRMVGLGLGLSLLTIPLINLVMGWLG